MNPSFDSQTSSPIGCAPSAGGHVGPHQRSAAALAGQTRRDAERMLTAGDVRDLIRLKRVMDICRFSGAPDERA